LAKHSSVVGGSTAALRRLCNGSIELSQGLPEEAWNAYAATGTALHAIVEQAIDQALTDEDILVQHAGADREGVRITREILLGKALPAVNWFEKEIPLSAAVHLEKSVNFNGIIEGAFGTADIVFSDPDTGRHGIVDWKFGDNHIVSAQDNDQMRFYLAGAVHCGYLPMGALYEAWIFQPSAKLQQQEFASRGLYSHGDLNFFVQDLKDAIEGERRFVTGEHCRFCRGKIRCDAYQKMLRQDVDTDVAGLTANGLSAALNRVPVIENYIKDLKAAALRNAQNGIHIPGYALVRSEGNRAWIDEDAAWAALGRLGVPAADRTVKKPISPTQAERVLKPMNLGKRAESFMKAHVHRPDRGETLVKSDKPSEHTFTRLATALKAIT